MNTLKELSVVPLLKKESPKTEECPSTVIDFVEYKKDLIDKCVLLYNRKKFMYCLMILLANKELIQTFKSKVDFNFTIFFDTDKIIDTLYLPEFDLFCDNINELIIILCKHNKIKEVRSLIQHKDFDINYKNCYNNTALYIAGSFNNKKIVEMLLDQKVININFIQDCGDDSILLVACDDNHYDIVQLLLKYENIIVNIQNEHGFTPLMAASMNGDENIVKLLLEHKDIDIDIRDCYDMTALMLAERENHANTVNLLLEYEMKKWGQIYEC